MAQQQRQQQQPAQTSGMQRGQPQEKPRGGLSRAEYASPHSMMRRLMDEMDRLFTGFGVGGADLAVPYWIPSLETFERDGRLVVRTDLPGLAKEDVRVELVGDELVISGERKREQEETRKGRYYSERSYGSFERRVTLPEGCSPEGIEASFENGVLEVSVAAPKAEGARGRVVEIKGGKPKEGEPGKGGSSPIH